MATTASILSGAQGTDLFYFLKITGIPVTFFCAFNPGDAKYGAFTWDFDGRTAVQGMMLPDDRLSQSIPDIIGGVASAERISLTLADFNLTDANGSYGYLARLFSPGIAVANGTCYELASDIGADATGATAVKLRMSELGTAPANGDYTVGGETISMSTFGAPDANGVCTGQIVARNLYPCSLVYPPVPSHRIVKNEAQANAGGRNIPVTLNTTPYTMIGRTAAFYIGHMIGVGGAQVPCTEAETLLRLIGRIKSVDCGGAGGTYSIEIESLMADLKDAKAANGLGVATILDNQIVLPLIDGGPSGKIEWWRVMHVQWGKPGEQANKHVSIIIDDTGITNSIYTRHDLTKKINEALAATGDPVFAAIVLGTRWVDGEERFYFSTYAGTVVVGVTLSMEVSIPAWGGLIHALGFEIGDDKAPIKFEKDPEDNVSTTTGPLHVVAIASRAVPSVFIPVTVTGDTPAKFYIKGMDGSSSQYFFIDQTDGVEDIAYVQFGDGSIVQVDALGTDASGDYLTTSTQHLVQFVGTQRNPNPREDTTPFYYVPRNGQASVKQVVVAGSMTDEVDPGQFIGRFLASYDPDSATDEWNYYSEGVGLAWYQLLDLDAFASLSAVGTPYPRVVVVDSDTKLMDVIGAILKEYGVTLVWNPETSQVTLRTLRIPSAPTAHAVTFNGSNRTSPQDRTSYKTDQSNIRSSWTLKWGWNIAEKKFVATPVTIVDNAVLSAGVSEKAETIEDKTLAAGSDLDGLEFLNTMVFARSDIYRQEWRRCRRTLNRTGLTLSPGSYHQVIDAVLDDFGNIIDGMTNPFTGRRGITAADGIYALLMSVEGNPATGMCEVEFLVSKQGQSSLYRPWSPTGLVDYAAPNRGYDSGTGVWTMASRYSAPLEDGTAFQVGDPVVIMAWDCGATNVPYSQTTTLTAVAADGTTVTGAAGLLAVPVDVEVIIVLDEYSSNTTRQATVAFQGNYGTRIIDAVPGAKNHRWG